MPDDIDGVTNIDASEDENKTKASTSEALRASRTTDAPAANHAPKNASNFKIAPAGITTHSDKPDSSQRKASYRSDELEKNFRELEDLQSTNETVPLGENKVTTQVSLREPRKKTILQNPASLEPLQRKPALLQNSFGDGDSVPTSLLKPEIVIGPTGPPPPQVTHEWHTKGNGSSNINAEREPEIKDSSELTAADLLGFISDSNHLRRPDRMPPHDPVLQLNQISTVYHLDQFLSSILYREASFSFLITPPPMVKSELWVFLHVRQLAKDMNYLAIELYKDGCKTKPECQENMRIRSRTIRCGSHEPPQKCPPMNYVWHTLDWAMELLSLDSLNMNQE